jgi:hypothetical protein
MKKAYIIGILIALVIAVAAGYSILNQQGRPFKYRNLQDKMFSELPKIPDNFLAKRAVFENGMIELKDVSEEYYLQPEFYPTWESMGIKLMEEGKVNFYRKISATIYPSEYMLETETGSGVYEGNFIARSEFSSEAYFGLSFIQTIPEICDLRENNFGDNEMQISQNSTYVSDRVKLTFEPKSVLLEPSYNLEGKFSKGWAKKVKFTLETKNLSPGKYCIGVRFGKPDKTLSSQWANEYLTEYLDYGSGNSAMISMGENMKLYLWVR